MIPYSFGDGVYNDLSFLVLLWSLSPEPVEGSNGRRADISN